MVVDVLFEVGQAAVSDPDCVSAKVPVKQFFLFFFFFLSLFERDYVTHDPRGIPRQVA